MGLIRRRRGGGTAPVTADAAPAERGGRSLGFKGAWPAVRAGAAAEVAEALGLRDVPASLLGRR